MRITGEIISKKTKSKCKNCGHYSKAVKNDKSCPRCETDPEKIVFGLHDVIINEVYNKYTK